MTKIDEWVETGKQYKTLQVEYDLPMSEYDTKGIYTTKGTIEYDPKRDALFITGIYGSVLQLKVCAGRNLYLALKELYEEGE